jgi:hypothetical protein
LSLIPSANDLSNVISIQFVVSRQKLAGSIAHFTNRI